MIEFAAALLVFLAAHSLPAATGLRGRLMTRFGRRAYLTVYSVLSITVLIWLISAAQRAPTVFVWPPSPVTALVPLIAMAPACLLFVAGLARPNPLSVSFRGGATPADAPGILSLTRHPILWAFFLWAGAHAAANGDVVGLIMFGGFAAFSLAGMRIMVARARRTLPAAEFAAAWAVADGTVGARLRRAWSGRTALELAVGAALYAGTLTAHGPVIGIDPLAAL